MFSVVLPVYNGERFVDKAIESVLKQTVEDFELIVINDGSTDATLCVLERYKQNQKVFCYTKQNQGVSAARNMGIELAKGEYIAFIDADDLWQENHLCVLSEMINTYRDAGMYCTFARTALVNGRIIDECDYFKDKPETVYVKDFWAEYDKDKSAKMFNVISTCVTKEACDRAGGFPVGCKIGEDLEFSLRVSAYYPVVLSSRSTTLYRKANSTATKDISFDPDWNFFNTVQELYDDDDISTQTKKSIKNVMTWFTIRKCRHLLIDNRRTEAYKCYKQIGKTHLKKDKLLTAMLFLFPTKLTKYIFRLRWKNNA